MLRRYAFEIRAHMREQRLVLRTDLRTDGGKRLARLGAFTGRFLQERKVDLTHLKLR